MTGALRKLKPLVSGLLLAALAATAEAAPTAAEITGEIERLTLNDATNVYSGGTMIVGGTQVILPKNLLIDLPANRLTLQQIFDQAPAACKSNGESGLAKADRCNATGTGGFATLSGVHSNAGNIIAGDVLIEKGQEVASGVVSYISYTDGYFRLNGIPNDPSTGIMVRLNDPISRHTVQQGAGCAGGPNCSPDPRFNLDPDNYTNAFSTGYPLCIPSTVPRQFPGLPAVTGIPAIGAGITQAAGDGTGDLLCPSTNRSPGVLEEPAVGDSRRFAPIMIGDSINAEGNFESIGGVRFLSAHTTRVNKALSTKNLPDQPDYLFLEEAFLEAPGFQNQRARMLLIGFTTLAPTDVDFWSIHRDPAANAIHEFPLASVQGCDNSDAAKAGPFPNGLCSSQGLVGAGANIFRIRYDVDFLLAAANDPKYPGGALAKLNPCLQLQASTRFAVSNPGICSGGVTLANNFGIMSPIPHEIQARTGHLLDNPGLAGKTIDVNGAVATNGQYLFPFGINLGGIETADFLEIDINLLNTPRIFEGIPWNLDRRLSPSGCLNAGGCENTPQPLDPFPFTGLDPRLQAEFLVAGLPGGTPKGTYNDPNFTNSALSNASNRVFSFVRGLPFVGGKFNFDGNNTLLGCGTGLFPASCPPDPGLVTINPTPVMNIYPPIADEDSATTTVGAPVTINVIANDFPVFGNIDPATVKIASNPASGTVQANIDGTITYTPTASFTVGSVSFTYTVANNYGAVSAPGTVNVTIVQPATAVTVSPTVVSPQVAGTPITFVAAGTGGSGSYEYRFWLNSGAGYAVARPYSTDSTWTWTPDTTGNYDIFVEVRNAGTSVLRDAYVLIPFYRITAAATTVSVVAGPASTQVAGSPVTFTATASGGSGSYEYRFWLNVGGTYHVVQNYDPNNVWIWNPTIPGVYDIFVEARTPGYNAINREAFTSLLGYRITAVPATSVTIAPDVTSPQAPSKQITFTASAAGGSGNYEYRFYLNSGAGYVLVQPYSTLNTFKFTPTTSGSYDIFVETRSVGSIADREAFASVLGYFIAPLPVTSVSLNPSLPSPQATTTSIAFTAAAAGGSGDYEYRFYLNSGLGYVLVQPYSTLNTWMFTPLATGSYDIKVETRSLGSASAFEASNAILGYQVQ